MSSSAALTNAIRRLRPPGGDAPADPVLLDRYARRGDQEAFTALVRRYGPLVLGVARRQLADRHRADDVFQATFLALARSAARLGGRPELTNWLYTVALRQARRARGRDARRAAVEGAAPPRQRGDGDPLAAVTGRELLRAVDDELARLPDRLRLPVLLCGVQGLSREEAAALLGCSDGVVKGRLERGRRLLAARLAARGLAPLAAILAPFAAVSVSADLLARTAVLAAAPWAPAIPPSVSSLAALRASRALLAAAALAGCVLAAAVAGLVGAPGRANPVQPAPEPVAAAVAQPANLDPDDPLPPGAALRLGTPRYRHTSEIESLAVSPNGKVAVATSGTRTFGAVRAYDLATGRVRYTCEASDAIAVAFSPDGRALAVQPLPSGGTGSVVLFDAATGERTASIPVPAGRGLLLFTPDSRHVLVEATEGKLLHLVSLSKGETVRTFGPADATFAAAVSPDGKTLVAGGYDYDKGGGWFARRWEVATGRVLPDLPVGKYGVRCVAYSPDGTTVAVGNDAQKSTEVKLIDAATNVERLSIPLPAASGVRSVALSPDGRTLAVASGSVTRLFDASTGKERATIARRATGLRFSPDGASLVGAVAGAVYRWDAATGKSLIPEGGDSPVAQVAVTPDGRRVVTVGDSGDGHVWDARTGAHLRRVGMNWQRGFALSPDGRFLVWPEADEAIQFKDPDQPNATHTGSRLRMLDLETGAAVERFGGFEGDAHTLAFTPGGRTLVTADRFRRAAGLRVWDVATGKVERTFPAAGGPDDRVWNARVSPDGTVLAVTYRGKSRGVRVEAVVRLWDVATGAEVAGPSPHWFQDDVVAYGPDRKTVAAARPNGPVEFRDAATGRVLGELRGPADRVTALGLGPEGQLYTGARDGTVLACDVRAPTPPPADRK